MKTHFLAVALIFVALLVSSCDGPAGPDGKDGSAYVMVTNSDGSLQSGSVFGSLPSHAYTNTYYSADPGTYSFDFVSKILSGVYYYTREWNGSYSISVNLGEKGGAGKPFWQPGDAGQDGADKYYKLDCTYSSGLGIYHNDQFWKLGKTSADTLVEGKSYSLDYVDDTYRVHIQCQFKNMSVKGIDKDKVAR